MPGSQQRQPSVLRERGWRRVHHLRESGLRLEHVELGGNAGTSLEVAGALAEPIRGSLAIVHTDELASEAREALVYAGLANVGSFLSVRLSNDGIDFAGQSPLLAATRPP